MSKTSKKQSATRITGSDDASGLRKLVAFRARQSATSSDRGERSWLNTIPFYGVVALLAYMPFHIFLAQSLSLLTGGLEAWKIGKDVFLALLLLFTFCSVIWQRKATRLFWWLAGFVAVYAGLHGLLWLANPDIYTRSALLGMIYNVRVPGFLLLGYGALLLTPYKFAFSSLARLVLGVGVVVAALGLLQYLLPPDLLTHVGYGLDRGARPVFYIDDHPGLLRIMSTLREPNALGAYLLVPFVTALALLLKTQDAGKRWLFGGIAGVTLSALFLTHSRSAWLAAALVAGLTVWWRYKTVVWQVAKRWWPAVVVLVLLIGTVGWMQRNSSFVQEYIIHSNPEEQVDDLDSNDLHWLLVKQGVEGIIDQPLGHGPGTAGLVSIQNPNGGLLTENYYVQIGYEVGVLGLLLFVALNIWVYIRIWRNHSRLGVVVCITFWGYVLTNMLLHTWSNEAVAAQWWLLAGIALGWPVAKTTDKP